MYLASIFLTLSIVSVQGIQKCEQVLPCEDLDWTKLTGSWYHLMFIPGGKSFLTCRNMLINDVDVPSKTVSVYFNDAMSYNKNPKLNRYDSVFFKWKENQAVISTGIKSVLHNIKYSSSKFAAKRKSSNQNLAETKSKYTMISTNNKDYIVLVQCQTGVLPTVWISLKSKNPGSHLTELIREELISSGIDAKDLNFDGTDSCLS